MLGLVVVVATLSACNPAFNWRDYRSPDAAFHVLFPAKPATYSRTVDLDGLSVLMTMTAAEVDGATFAVGSAELPDAGRAPAAVQAMKTALLKNIGATAKSTHSSAEALQQTGLVLEPGIEASGASPTGVPLQLSGHFFTRERRVYQVIVVSQGTPVAREHIDMFLGSFSLN